MLSSTVAEDIQSYLMSKSIPPTWAWLTGFLSGQKSSIPVPALKQTAFFRIIQTDITKSVDLERIGGLPVDIGNATIQERRILGPVTVQVLDVEDIGRSKWSQLEAIEADERGETTKGREIIRAVPSGDGEQEASSSIGPHKLLLQDARGAVAYGLELSDVDGISLTMSIGSKIVLENTIIARGVLLLEPKTVTVLGGRIEEMHQSWKSGRKAALKEAVQSAGADR